MSLQRDTLAIMFADIVGYTTMMQRGEAAAAQALKQYKATIQAAVPAAGGDIRQFYGDGCLAVFPAAPAAVDSAVALQAAFLAAGIPVRIGLHLGEVVQEDEHIYGDAINVTARIESMGLAGAVLLSETVAGQLPEGPDYPRAHLGVFAFKHVTEPLAVYALSRPGLTVPSPRQLLRKGTAYQIDNSPPPDESAPAPVQVLVVEDDMIVGAHISMVLAEAGYEVVGLIPTGEAALAQIATLPPDLVLMDVQLKGKLDGVETAAQIYAAHQVPVIFLTANTDPATFARAKLTFPYAFIGKPFQPAALLHAIELVVQRLEETTEPEEAGDVATEPPALPAADHIFVRDKDRMVKVRLADIRYLEAERNYCRIHTQHRQYLLSVPMKTLEARLGTVHFVRSHRSFVVNVEAIEGFDESYLYLGDDPIPLGKAYKEEVYRRLERV